MATLKAQERRRTPPAATRAGRLQQALSLLVPAGLAVAVYCNTLLNGFVNDDEHQILLNPWIQSWSFIPKIFHSSVWEFMGTRTVTDYYRPMMHLANMLLYHLFGFQPAAYHLTMVLLHAANTVMVVLLTRRLIQWSAPPSESSENAPGWLLSVPFVAGLLFAAHPVHTEAVDWIASLPELMFTLFFLLSLWFYIAPAGPLMAPSLIFFGLALLCKETAVTLPAILIAFDLALRKKSRIKEYGAYAVTAAVYLVIRHSILSAIMISNRNYWGLNVFELLLNALILFRDYLGLLILPVSLNFWHPFHPVKSWSLEGITAIAVCLAYLGAAGIAWKKNRLCFFSLLVLLIPLAPAFYISALPFKVFAERYLYLPSAGYAILVAVFIHHLATWRRLRAAAAAIVIIIMALHSTATILRNKVWENAYTLYMDTVVKTPDAPVPPYDLATLLLNKGHVHEAVAHFRILAQVNPGDPAYASSLGAALIVQGDLDEGIHRLQAAMALDPKSLEAANNLAIALGKKGRIEEAAALYRKTLDIDPSYPDAHLNYGNLLANQGKMAEAMMHYEAAVKLSPENAYYRNILGIEYAKQGRVQEAFSEFQEAVRLAPAEPAYKRNLDRAQSMLNETKP